MNAGPRPLRARRHAARRLVVLLALAPIGGCDCTGTLPLVPNPLPPLSAVVVSPTSDTLRVGEERQFSAVAYDTLGQPVASAGFRWTSGDPGVFTVAASGRVTGVGDGVAWLYAELGGRRDSASVSVYPDTGWFVQTSNTSRSLYGVFFQPDGRTGWAVGAGGAIVRTTDAGATWQTQASHVAVNLNGVFFAHPDTGWVVGNGGTILRTVNRGVTWVRVSVGAGENLLDVTFANSDTGFVVGSAGVVLRTVNGGRNWEKLNLTSFALQGVAFAGTRDGWAVGDGGEIFGTDDAGETWTQVQPAITLQSLRAVWRRSTAAAWAAGDQGVTPRTTVVGNAVVWQLGNAGAAYQLEGVHYPTDLIGYAVGYSGAGAVLRTDDGGASWQTQTSRTSRQLNDVFFVDALRGWAVGEGGSIVHTARGGLR